MSQHGTYVRYVKAHCRCVACRKAKRVYEATIRATRRRLAIARLNVAARCMTLETA
jgi:hypothetical protein